ncbi:NAD(P)-binding domain-containing protein [Candidatus Micrarchaeota archaeon]|nr:NAD(P)-binding domain-containing protein [Candidatus Micrarchaeota archaeon]
MKISVFEADEIEKNILGRKLKPDRLEFFDEPLTLRNCGLAKDSQVVVVFIHSQVDKKLLSRLPKLKIIATLSTGTDHIDLKECQKREIVVSSVPSYGEDTVAEHTFALILAHSRKIIESVERVKKGSFSPSGLTGFNLNGKTIGIIGTGKIGSYVAKLSSALGMNILAFSKHRNEEIERKYGVRYVKALKELLSGSDIISLNCPLTKETHHLINRKNMNWIKKGAMLINTARGALIQTEALVEALKIGRISYAGLDVLEEEENITEEKELLAKKKGDQRELKTALANHILVTSPNVLITPHNAFNSKEALEKIGVVTAENILSALKKRKGVT